MTTAGAARYRLERLGVVLEPAPGDAREAEGVLNPGSARGPDGELYLFPRLVAAGNYSRIGRARVRFDGDRLVGVDRLGVVLEPEEDWERNPHTGGGVEDPRVTRLAELDAYVMAYAAYGPQEPRVALAFSRDLVRWERLGPVSFAHDAALGADLGTCTNKDAALFPELVLAPNGEPSYAMLHRPTWSAAPRGLPDERPSIWISFAPAQRLDGDVRRLGAFEQHRLIVTPVEPWEAAKIGAGPPPVRTRNGWLLVYHGVDANLVYSAGALVLAHDDVTRVVWRSREPLLAPQTAGERIGTVPNVVFPTAIDARSDYADVYYGMADARVGAARLRPVS